LIHGKKSGKKIARVSREGGGAKGREGRKLEHGLDGPAHHLARSLDVLVVENTEKPLGRVERFAGGGKLREGLIGDGAGAVRGYQETGGKKNRSIPGHL